MQYLQFRKKKYGPVATCYEELAAKQFVKVCYIISKELPELEAQLQVLRVLLNVSLIRFAFMNTNAKAAMLEHVRWVFADLSFTKQLLPSYRGFIGPKQEFDNLTLGEFHFSEKHYKQARQSEPAALAHLCAVLYRKPKKHYNYLLDTDGDARIKFNANELPYYASITDKWPPQVKVAILTWYDNCRQNMLELYDDVFSGGAGEESEAGMFDVIRGLSGPVYGPIERVEDLNIYTALNEISKQLKEAEAQKQQ